MIKESIFRAYDIRGIYPEDIDEEVAYKVGLGFAAYLGNKGKVSVGRDVRISGKALQEHVIRGLKDGGLNVVELGLITTPILYFSIIYYHLDGGIMVTASHNPPEWNGFKLCREKAETIAEGKGMEELKDIILNSKFKISRRGRKIVKRNFVEDYLSFIKSKVNIKRPLKVIMDLSSGSCSTIAPRLFKDLGMEVKSMNAEPDGNFPAHAPEPNEETLKPLIELVKFHYDFGVGYDGDGDRALFVDDKGRIIRGDKMLAILSKYYLKSSKGSVVFDIASSSIIKEIVEAYGGEAIVSRVGHAFIKEKMLKHKALLGGEVSSHLYFGDIFGIDDAIFASLKVAEILSQSDKKLSEMVDEVPNYPSIPVTNFYCPDDKKFKVIRELIEEFKAKNYNIDTLDGLKVNLEDGWFLLRASNTLPQIKLVAEAKNEKKLVELVNLAKEALIKRIQ